MIHAVIFDLGNTLISSSLPLSWQDYYGEVMAKVLSGIGTEANQRNIDIGKDILAKYNTRLHPREQEIHVDRIFTDLFEGWGIIDTSLMQQGEKIFASFFFDRSVVYPETIEVLQNLKDIKLKTGVLTNVAYGLGREFMVRDIAQVKPYIDVLLTSVETGFRKPNTTGYFRIAESLGIEPGECLFVGDEEVDVTGANASGMVSVLVDRDGSDNAYGQRYTVTNLKELIPLLKRL